MHEVSVLLKHSGVWVTKNLYESSSMDGIVVRHDIPYNLFKEEIACQLGIDQTEKNLQLRYVLEGHTVPMEIRNDMGVKMYLSMVKCVPDMLKFPLCVDSRDKEVAVCNIDGGSGITNSGGPGNLNSVLMFMNDDRDSTSAPKRFSIISDPYNKFIRRKQTYIDKKTLVSVMRSYAVEHRFQYLTKQSCTSRYELNCCVATCPWYFRASRISKTKYFKIRDFNNSHSCAIDERTFEQRQATYRMVAGQCIQQLKNHKRKHTPNDIKDDLLNSKGVDITYMKAWRGKELAMKMLLGEPADSYRKLPIYLHVLGSTNPNSYIRFHTSSDNKFMYLFIALGVSIGGFNHCRPIVVVDASALKGPYMGTFISASTLDGAGNILPLAYGVVDSENDASWTWFFKQFRAAFGVRREMAIVSDRCESIWKGVRLVFPELPHYACMWHVWQNFCKLYRSSQDTLSVVYFEMAKCYRREEFEDLMAQVESIDPRVKQFLANVGFNKWARCFATVNRERMTTSNIAECINGCLVEARRLPLIEFLEKTRELFARWNVVNGEKERFMSDELLGSRYQRILAANDIKSVRLKAVKSSESLYTVDSDDIRYIVCLDKKTCTCNRYQYDGVPCEHAIAVLRSKHITGLVPYCSTYYTKSTLEKIYKDQFPPMPLRKQWTAPDSVVAQVVLPPQYKRPPGRPRLVRWKNRSELLRSRNKCGKCGKKGHNRRGCAFFPKDQ